jgi:tripartite ATP-independent transporter DctM subunit
MTIAVLGCAALLLLLFGRLPIAFAMGVVGFVGFGLLVGWPGSLTMVGRQAFDTATSYELSVIPLFVLMGNFVTRAGLSEELYAAAYSWIGHRRGGLAMATILSCAGFAAVCGSSLATAATMAKVTMPPMRKFGYADSLATGSIAAGGTLGILIPPSVILAVYGIITSTDIGVLFVAGVVPGLLGAVLYVTAIMVTTYFKPELGPPGERTPWPERFRTLGQVWGILALFLLVMGGIYAGLFTPTEAAGVGATGACLFAYFRGRMKWRGLVEVLIDSTKTSAMIFFVIVGANIFSNLINESGLSEAMAKWVIGLDIPPLSVIAVIMVIYVILGCFLESMSMILLTVPLFFPMIVKLGFDPIWFGIIVVVVTEISLITPPIGMNIFVLNTVLPEVSTTTIFRGVLPFVAIDIVRLALLVAFPAVTLFLPSLMR